MTLPTALKMKSIVPSLARKTWGTRAFVEGTFFTPSCLEFMGTKMSQQDFGLKILLLWSTTDREETQRNPEEQKK